MKRLLATFLVLVPVVLGCTPNRNAQVLGIRGSDNGGSWVETQFLSAAQLVPRILLASENIAITTEAERTAISALVAEGAHVLAINPVALPAGRFADRDGAPVVASDRLLDADGQPKDAVVANDLVVGAWTILLDLPVFERLFTQRQPVMALVSHEIWRLAYFSGGVARNDGDAAVTGRLTIGPALEFPAGIVADKPISKPVVEDPVPAPNEIGRWERFPSAGDFSGRNRVVKAGDRLFACCASTPRIYDLKTQTWAEVAKGAPSPRTDHALAYTGDAVIVWGGSRRETSWPGATLGDGAVYRLGTDEWTQISSAGAPSPRAQVLEAWTGRELLVFGGVARDLLPGVALNNGALYDPRTDTWRPIASPEMLADTNSSLPYQGFWTGDHLIVFSGLKGASYDPASDSWLALSMENGPTVSNKLVAWNGDNAFVWGGYDAGAYLYDVAADRWERQHDDVTADPMAPPMSVILQQTRMTSCGGRFVVWGEGRTTQGAGGIYDPATKSWKLFPSAGAPALSQMVGGQTSIDVLCIDNSVHIWGGSPETSGILRLPAN